MKLYPPRLVVFLEQYFLWHYGQAYSDMLNIWKNFLWFVSYFFSLKILLSTLFQPWKRMGEDYPRGFDPSVLFQVFIVNTLMRVVGFFVRVIIITFGVISLFTVFVLGIAGFFLWTVMPVFLVVLLVLGVTLIIFG